MLCSFLVALKYDVSVSGPIHCQKEGSYPKIDARDSQVKSREVYVYFESKARGDEPSGNHIPGSNISGVQFESTIIIIKCLFRPPTVGHRCTHAVVKQPVLRRNEEIM